MSATTLAPTKTFASVETAWELPPLSVPITATLITATAIATRDYENVHHDLESTRKLGSPHIFMNILTTNGFCQRFIEEAFGPECVFKDLKIKLGAPNYVGDTMKLTGSVTAIAPTPMMRPACDETRPDSSELDAREITPSMTSVSRAVGTTTTPVRVMNATNCRL